LKITGVKLLASNTCRPTRSFTKFYDSGVTKGRQSGAGEGGIIDLPKIFYDHKQTTEGSLIKFAE